MQGFRKQHHIKYRILRFFAMVGGVCALLFMISITVRATWNIYGKFAEASRASAATSAEFDALVAREAVIALAITRLDSNRGIEAQLREKYGVALPGEGEIRIVRDTKDSNSTKDAYREGVFTHIFRSLIVW